MASKSCTESVPLLNSKVCTWLRANACATAWSPLLELAAPESDELMGKGAISTPEMRSVSRVRRPSTAAKQAASITHTQWLTRLILDRQVEVTESGVRASQQIGL